jgi:hypothetical protein
MPRDLSIPRAATDVSAGYHVVGTGPRVRGDARFEPSTVAGAQIAAGSTVGFSIEGKNIGYEADATVTNLDLQQVGQQFQVKGLETDRYKSSVDAHVSASGHGTTAKDVDLTATGTVTDSSILGARIPQLAFNARFADDNLHVQADGSFADADPSVASGRPAMKAARRLAERRCHHRGRLSGRHRGHRPGVSEGESGAIVDRRSRITRATLDRDYHRRRAIRALCDCRAGLNVTASGRVALNDSGHRI